jgi:predicted nucleotidyltransferase
MFGSYAYGNPNTNSDIDLCILIDRQDKRKIDIIKSIRSSIAKVASKPVDLVLYFNDEFHEKANITCTLESKIENEGVKLYMISHFLKLLLNVLISLIMVHKSDTHFI